MNEIWKEVQGYEGYYLISSTGKIKSLPREQLMKNGRKRFYKERLRSHSTKRNGYKFIALYNEDGFKQYHIHRLVATHFIPNTENLSDVNHIDGNKDNNAVVNLEWVSHSDNLKHAYETGLKVKGGGHSQSKISDDDVRFIKENYKPRDPSFGAKPLSEKFGVAKSYISRIASGEKRVTR